MPASHILLCRLNSMKHLHALRAAGCVVALFLPRLWAQNADTSAPREVRDLPYVTGGHERQQLDLFLPVAGAKRPLVLWIHGGGWESGSKSGCPARGMVARGYAVASVGYRLSQHAIYPAQIEDCKAAIRWLRAHASEYGLDPERFGVWGASAGGHLAALLGVTNTTREFAVGENLDQPSDVQCVVNWFGPADFLHWGNVPATNPENPRSPLTKLIGGTIKTRVELARRASPVYFVRKGAPPFLIMHGDRDEVVPLQQSRELHTALETAGADSTLRVYAGAGHGGGAFGSPENIKEMQDFFDKHLRPRTTAATD